jgi:hypothetical protein
VWWLKPIILATHEVEIRGLWFKANSGKKFMRPYLTVIGLVVHAHHPTYAGKYKMVWAGLDIK